MPNTELNLARNQRPDAGRTVVQPVPFDFAATAKMEGWRHDLAWPVSHAEQFELNEAVMRELLAVLRGIDDPDLLDVAVLAVATLASSTLILVETARAVHRESKAGLRLESEAPELAYLRGEISDEQRPEPRALSAFLPLARPRANALRRLARIRSWTPWSRMPAAIIAPQATAISHNSLLREVAGYSSFAIGFHHAETLYSTAMRERGTVEPIKGWEALVGLFVQALSGFDGIGEKGSERLSRLIRDQAEWLVERAARDLAALRRHKRLPRHIWSGSAGYWPTRALSIEVLRRGGEVIRFDHGGGSGFVAGSKAAALIDFVCASKFVLPTERLARACRDCGINDLLPDRRQIVFEGGRGDPKIRSVLAYPKARPTTRRRVLFAPAALVGFRQISPPLLSDPVHLDWQMRLAAMLKSLPVDLVCRAHPEGIVGGRDYPLSEVADLSPVPFEETAKESDVFVFYFGESTTFYVALCTDRPIVLIDLGLPIYTAEARAMIERRCRIVPASFDDRNLPQIDLEALAEAVCGGSPAADPSEYRAWVLGLEAADPTDSGPDLGIVPERGVSGPNGSS